MPPPYSAKKVGGVPAYKLARQERADVQLAPVTVTVRELTLLGYRRRAGCVCELVTHRRVLRPLAGARPRGARSAAARTSRRCGGRGPGVRLDRRRRARRRSRRRPESAAARLIPLEAAAARLPAVRLTERGAARAGHGNYVSLAGLRRMGPGPDSAARPAIAAGADGCGCSTRRERCWRSRKPAPDGLLHPVHRAGVKY